MAIAAPEQLNLDEDPFLYGGCRSVDCYQKHKLLGRGTYGEVFMAKEKTSGETVAVKKLKLENERDGFPIHAIREIKILNQLQHENVVKLKEIVTSPGTDRKDNDDGVYMVFEYMDHDLTGLANREGVRFNIPQVKCYMRQLLKAIHYCHVNGVLHRDIKSSNLLIDNEGSLKLADFGLARGLSSIDHPSSVNLTNRVVTVFYRPPELLLGATKYGSAVDMWSAGCVFAEFLLCGRAIFPGKTELEVLSKIVEVCGAPDEVNWPGVSKLPAYKNMNFKGMMTTRRPLREVFRHCDAPALELLEGMLTLDPSKRISAKDALNADYFWTDPLPCDPKTLPKYESSHELQIMSKKRQRPHEEETKFVAPKFPTVQYQQRSLSGIQPEQKQQIPHEEDAAKRPIVQYQQRPIRREENDEKGPKVENQQQPVPLEENAAKRSKVEYQQRPVPHEENAAKRSKVEYQQRPVPHEENAAKHPKVEYQHERPDVTKRQQVQYHEHHIFKVHRRHQQSERANQHSPEPYEENTPKRQQVRYHETHVFSFRRSRQQSEQAHGKEKTYRRIHDSRSPVAEEDSYSHDIRRSYRLEIRPRGRYSEARRYRQTGGFEDWISYKRSSPGATRRYRNSGGTASDWESYNGGSASYWRSNIRSGHRNRYDY